MGPTGGGTEESRSLGADGLGGRAGRLGPAPASGGLPSATPAAPAHGLPWAHTAPPCLGTPPLLRSAHSGPSSRTPGPPPLLALPSSSLKAPGALLAPPSPTARKARPVSPPLSHHKRCLYLPLSEKDGETCEGNRPSWKGGKGGCREPAAPSPQHKEEA